MSRTLQLSIRGLNAMLSHSARLADLLNASGVTEAIRQMETQQAAMEKALSLTDYAARHGELFKSATILHELSLLPSNSMQITFDQVHRSWLSEQRNIETIIESAEIAKIALSDISHHLATSKLPGSGIDYNALARSLNVPQATMSRVQASISELTISYLNLTESFGSVADVVKLPSFVLPGATSELSTTDYALEVLRPFDEELETKGEEVEVSPGFEDVVERSALIVLLDRVGSEFVVMYRGALEALNGDNPDRSRHVLASLRTLVDQLYLKFAPKDKVGEWIVERGLNAYLRDGKPIHRAQILYLSKDLYNEPLTKFIEADSKAVEELYQLYNRLHDPGTGLSDLQLRALVLMTESHLEYILRVREW